MRVIRREETTRRLGGHGDNFCLTWATDECQLTALCDGTGWTESPNHFYNSQLFTLRGAPEKATFERVSSYPKLMPSMLEDVPRYYSFGTLALDGRLYQFLSTFNHGIYRADRNLWTDLRFIGAKLIYSPDQGRTWCNQDGSTPVLWEGWRARSKESLAFFEEPGECFSLPSILQMGRNYEYNRDGYVYVYAPNGNAEGTMNELAMFRVPKGELLDRGAYEYFSGYGSDGSACWVKDITARGVVHTFPRGWVNTSFHPYAWQPSVVYNAPLRLYLMANWGMGCGFDGSWFGKPSYLGFWIASNPWGPWRQIHEETAWMPENDPGARAYQPQIAPKWIAPDGKSFWLVWTDFQVLDEDAKQRLNAQWAHIRTPEEHVRWHVQWRKNHPYYGFNTQRVDLHIEDGFAASL